MGSARPGGPCGAPYSKTNAVSAPRGSASFGWRGPGWTRGPGWRPGPYGIARRRGRA